MKKLITATLLVASTMFAGGFGTATTDADIQLDNPFNR